MGLNILLRNMTFMRWIPEYEVGNKHQLFRGHLHYGLLKCQGHIKGGDGMVNRNPSTIHLLKQGFFYIPQLRHAMR